jgi:DNA (cytosine-5)-methyltransferase 1
MSTGKVTTELNLADYRELKSRYFSLTSGRKLPRGRLRAMIGAISAVSERDLVMGGYNSDEAHIVAFSEAIAIAEAIKDKGELDNRLNSSIKEWMNSRTKAEPLWEDVTGTPEKGHLTRGCSFRAISLFSGAMGLDIGFMQSGVNILLGNDIEKESCNTVLSNLPDMRFLNKDIDDVTPADLTREAGISSGELDILIGGPPCQPFSPAGKRAGLNDPRASPLKYFIRAIKEIRPAAFVMEEVPGLLSSRLKHFPYYDKYTRKPVGDEERGSAFKVVTEMLDSTGYRYAYATLNAADYGAPQFRNRVIFIGLKEGEPSFPEPTHAGNGSSGRDPWVTFWEAARSFRYTKDLGLAEGDARFMGYVPPGGNWSQMPPEIARKAMGKALESEGGRMGFFRRIAWDEPSPTLVTTPTQKGTFLVHPEFDRFLSIPEYKILQGFPEWWRITGTTESQYKLIGNAVPIHLSMAVASHVTKILKGEPIQ